MHYEVYDAEISQTELIDYLNTVINRLFAVLGIFEDCSEINDMTNYYIYLERVIYEMSGGYENLGAGNFLQIVNVLCGLRDDEKVTHRKVKSTIFHCISVVNKIKAESGD